MLLRVMLCVVLFGVISTSKAQETKEDTAAPRSSDAALALVKYNRGLKDADETWRKSVIQVHKAYIDELKELQGKAMKAQNLNEANALEHVIKEINAKLQDLINSQGNSLVAAKKVLVKNVEIFADKFWQPAGLMKKGMTLEITAKGKWAAAPKWELVGPDGLNKDNKIIRSEVLVGRVGKQEFEVGNGTNVLVEEDGMLEFKMRETSSTFSGFGDNRGSIQVTIRQMP